MKSRKLNAVIALSTAIALPSAFSQDLLVDFNSNQDGGGDSTTEVDPNGSVANHNQDGYQSYHANHEVIAEFGPADFDAFGTEVTFRVS